MKNSKWYDISSFAIVLFSLGYFSSVAYYYLWDKYKKPILKKWAYIYLIVYVSLIIWVIVAFLLHAEYAVGLWVFASLIMYLVSIIQNLYYIITLENDSRYPEESRKVPVHKNQVLSEEHYLTVINENKRLEKREYQLQLEIRKLKKELENKNYSRDQKSDFSSEDDYKKLLLDNKALKDRNTELKLELTRCMDKSSNSNQKNHNNDRDYDLLLVKYQQLEKQNSELKTRFENLQNSIIDKHEKRNKIIHQQIKDSEEQLVDPKLNETSFLREMGYQITGSNRETRWRVLERAVAQHGLKKVVKTIDGTLSFRVKQNNGRKKYAYAISEWNHDLEKLKRVYYKGNFPWPPKR